MVVLHKVVELVHPLMELVFIGAAARDERRDFSHDVPEVVRPQQQHEDDVVLLQVVDRRDVLMTKAIPVRALAWISIVN
jgi:hypothetical protein